MNRLNQTEPATFSILPCWAFFRDSVFIYYYFIHQRNTEGRRLGTVSSIMTAGEFKPVNGAPNLSLSPTMFL
jgi:hypothetical protein